MFSPTGMSVNFKLFTFVHVRVQIRHSGTGALRRQLNVLIFPSQHDLNGALDVGSIISYIYFYSSPKANKEKVTSPE